MNELIQSAESIGCPLSLEGERIKVEGISRLPASLLERIKEHKAQIVETLKNDQEARNRGFMVGVPGEIYTKSLHHKSNVYVEKIGDQWEAWRETYQKGKTVSTKVIMTGNTLEYVLVKVSQYFDYMEKKRHERGSVK
ncbi:hypothetical protein AAEO50_12260 [Rossellomorea oryzaecorticis]|uniref:Uncharacterized protein n=1 Tax=Rossellomorea oryzaecorticis TaxID=1396505 RepID=A0ABU9KAB9_9BACI